MSHSFLEGVGLFIFITSMQATCLMATLEVISQSLELWTRPIV